MAVVLKEYHLSELLDKIKEWPGFARMGGEVRCRLEGMMTDYDFIADRWPDISAVVLQPNKLNRKKGHPPWIPMCARNSESLAFILNELETFNNPDSLMFASYIDTKLEPAILEIVTSRNIPFYRLGPYLLMTTSSDQLKLSPVPPGLSLANLQPEQSEIVTKNWHYYIHSQLEDAVAYVKEMITSMPSVALYDENQTLVGYAITYHYGIPGMLHVMEEYRGQGHAKVIMSRLATLVLEKSKDDVVFVFVDPSNEASIQLHKRIGFEIVPDVRTVWIVCNPT